MVFAVDAAVLRLCLLETVGLLCAGWMVGLFGELVCCFGFLFGFLGACFIL